MKEDPRTWPIEAETSLVLRSHKVRIDIVRGPDAGLSVELPGPEARIGSGKDCDFVLRDPTVSRLHLRLRIEGDAIRVMDEGSRNGTTVDGVRIRDAYARPDSSIDIGGSSLRLRMLRELVELPLSSNDRFGQLLGSSVAMRRVFSLLERFAPTDTTLLIEGETGTGKELVARGVHTTSHRARAPFIVFDCSAVSATLIESELFGHERGAFTDARQERKGRFEAAHGGTLFLDEIGELPLELQPKLLRALENREIYRVGSNEARRVDVRIVAATNRCLTREVDRGRFREDLYYRLSVAPIRLPPLRARAEDIPMLVRSFEQAWRDAGKNPAPLSDAALSLLKAQSWPGNVRELRNKVDMMLALGLTGLPDEDHEPDPVEEVVPAMMTVNLG
ncbi:MAG TPA: sigma 54-interacting transcriptional regulator, partial [Candidatus Nanopelagicales bacterium]|nr:sigma 54-interacting transcriptional regulator [Candidatus Nanopelagicales bacterium]